jgi:hypothetical protein
MSANFTRLQLKSSWHWCKISLLSFHIHSHNTHKSTKLNFTDQRFIVHELQKSPTAQAPYVLTIIKNRAASTWLDTGAVDKTQWSAKLLQTSTQNSRLMSLYPAKTSSTLSLLPQLELSLSSCLPNFPVQSLHTPSFFALASSTSMSRSRFPRRHILLHHSSMQRCIHSINPAVISLLYHPKQPDRYLPMHLMHNQSKPLLKRR